MCANFIQEWRGTCSFKSTPNDRFFRNWAKKYFFFYISFCWRCMTWSLNLDLLFTTSPKTFNSKIYVQSDSIQDYVASSNRTEQNRTEQKIKKKFKMMINLGSLMTCVNKYSKVIIRNSFRRKRCENGLVPRQIISIKNDFYFLFFYSFYFIFENIYLENKLKTKK